MKGERCQGLDGGHGGIMAREADEAAGVPGVAGQLTSALYRVTLSIRAIDA